MAGDTPDSRDFLLRTAAVRLADIGQALAGEIVKIPDAHKGNIARASIGVIEVLQALHQVLNEGQAHAPVVSPGATLAHNEGSMTDITREELSARLELVESKADARLSRFEERIDQAIGEMRRDRTEIKAAIGNLKTTTIVTAISAVLAIVLGIAAFNATVLSNMVASFESGKTTTTAIGDATTRLEKLQDRIEAQQKPSAK